MGFFGGGEKDVVIVLDRSGSMNLKRKDGSTAFDAAVAEARDLVEQAPRGVSFGLVLGGRDAEVMTATPFASKRDVLKMLDEVKPGDETMDVPRAIEAAGEVLSGGSHLAKEIVIFGDGQGYGWLAGDVNAWRRVGGALGAFARRPPVVWRLLERPEGVRNAAISSVVPSREIFGTDRPVTFTVTVVNSGSEAFSPGELSLSVDGKRMASQPVGQVLPGLSRTIPFSCSFDKVGAHTVVTALAGGDDIVSDNTVTNLVTVVDELKVLVVNGRPGSTGFSRPSAYVEAALRPELKEDAEKKTPFLVKPTVVRPSELESTNILGGVAVSILCDVPFLSERAGDNLARWVSEGGGVLAIPGERVDLGFCTNWTWREKRVLPAVWTNFCKTASNRKPPLYDGGPVAGRMLFDEGAIDTNRATVVSRLDDGSAAFVSGRFGKGRIGMLAMPLDLGWTGLPARPGFVPLVHSLVYSLSAVRSAEATEDIGWSAREGDMAPLTARETDEIVTHIDLSLARLKDDVLASVVGRGFGVEIWRPLAIIVLVLMIVEIFLCRFIDRSRAGEGDLIPRSKVRTVLRALAVLALAWMLWHVVWVHDRERKVSRKVAVLVDQSLSMRRRETGENGVTNRCSRLTAATNAAVRLEALLGEKYDIEEFSFGGDVTDFAAALEDVRTRVPSEELAGAVLITDGRPTAGADVEAVARAFARQGAKISSVIVGNVTNRPDLAIQDVWTAENLFLGDHVNVQVTLRADMLKGEKAVVKFMRDGRELERQTVKIDGDAWTHELRFSDTPKEKGLYRYRLAIEAPEKDSEAENDAWPFDVSVSDDRTNILIADRRPRWEFRYLRNLLYGRDKSVHLQYLLTEPDRLEGEAKTPRAAADATRPYGDAESGCLPEGRDAWRKFDVMVFGDLAPDTFLDEEVADIRACIEERGALVIFVAGGKHMPLAYAKGPLAELLPVALTNDEGRVTAEWRQGPYQFAVTGAGHAHEIMRLSESDAENVRIWESGCEWQRRLEGLTAKPGTETLAFAGDSSALKSPLLVVQHRGRGHVVFLASDETWRFRYKIGDTYHHRFWGNVVRWGVGERLRDGTEHARIGTDRIHYAPESPVRIRARLSDADSLPMDGMEVNCTVTDPKGSRVTFRLQDHNLANGTYEGVYKETVTPGDYRIEVTCPEARRKLGDKWPAELTTRFEVKTAFAPVEYAYLTSDTALADELAKLTGGEVFMLSSVTNFAGAKGLSFGGGRQTVIDHIEDPVWDHPLAFVVLALALILVWILRKRKGLS